MISDKLINFDRSSPATEELLEDWNEHPLDNSKADDYEDDGENDDEEEPFGTQLSCSHKKVLEIVQQLQVFNISR